MIGPLVWMPLDIWSSFSYSMTVKIAIQQTKQSSKDKNLTVGGKKTDVILEWYGIVGPWVWPPESKGPSFIREEENHSRQQDPYSTRKMGWLLSEQCHQTILLPKKWLVWDCLVKPIYWAAPNGTQWARGTHLWPWLPLDWLDWCTLRFMDTRNCHNILPPSANLPLLKTGWAQSVQLYFSISRYWCCHVTYDFLCRTSTHAPYA